MEWGGGSWCFLEFSVPWLFLKLGIIAGFSEQMCRYRFFPPTQNSMWSRWFEINMLPWAPSDASTQQSNLENIERMRKVSL